MATNASTTQADPGRIETRSITVTRRFEESDPLLKAGKSIVMFLGTSYQLGAVSTLSQIAVADRGLHRSGELKTMG